jgi:hypothetical protein
VWSRVKSANRADFLKMNSFFSPDFSDFKIKSQENSILIGQNPNFHIYYNIHFLCVQVLNRIKIKKNCAQLNINYCEYLLFIFIGVGDFLWAFAVFLVLQMHFLFWTNEEKCGFGALGL